METKRDFKLVLIGCAIALGLTRIAMTIWPTPVAAQSYVSQNYIDQELLVTNGALTQFKLKLNNYYVVLTSVKVYRNGLMQNMENSDYSLSQSNQAAYVPGSLAVVFSVAPASGDLIKVDYRYWTQNPLLNSAMRMNELTRTPWVDLRGAITQYPWN